MPLSVEEQQAILRQLSEEQIALLPVHVQELIYRTRELEEIGAVGGYYVEPESGTTAVVLPSKTKKKRK
jgi:hypothetical protein